MCVKLMLLSHPAFQPIKALVEKWRLVSRKRIVLPSLQRHNLLILCSKRSSGYHIGQANIHNARIWSLENPHEMLETQRDSPKLNIFCAISLGGKCIGLSFSENRL
ncbi:hypothetical protein TNCV_1852871 [Trichonephila clavipes]|nr:hypothetical protein TNCV_1852871 [Trichonephila clavipes]